MTLEIKRTSDPLYIPKISELCCGQIAINTATGCVYTKHCDPDTGIETLIENCPAEDEILGCTDSNSLNFNPDATVDDGSCISPPEPADNFVQQNDIENPHIPEEVNCPTQGTPEDDDPPNLAPREDELDPDSDSCCVESFVGIIKSVNVNANFLFDIEFLEDGWGGLPSFNHNTTTFLDTVNFPNPNRSTLPSGMTFVDGTVPSKVNPVLCQNKWKSKGKIMTNVVWKTPSRQLFPLPNTKGNIPAAANSTWPGEPLVTAPGGFYASGNNISAHLIGKVVTVKFAECGNISTAIPGERNGGPYFEYKDDENLIGILVSDSLANIPGDILQNSVTYDSRVGGVPSNTPPSGQMFVIEIDRDGFTKKDENGDIIILNAVKNSTGGILNVINTTQGSIEGNAGLFAGPSLIIKRDILGEFYTNEIFDTPL